MDPQEFHNMTVAMRKYGGSFVNALAVALRYADPSNRDKILAAFPELVSKYCSKSLQVR